MFRRPLSPTRLVRAAVLGAALLSTSTAAEARRAALRADVEGYAMAACLTRQDVPYLREQGHLWGNAILQRGHGSVEDWTTLADAVGAAAARQTMSMARGDGAVDDALKPMPLLFCHELVRSPAVRAAKVRAMRHLAPDYR